MQSSNDCLVNMFIQSHIQRARHLAASTAISSSSTTTTTPNSPLKSHNHYSCSPLSNRHNSNLNQHYRARSLSQNSRIHDVEHSRKTSHQKVSSKKIANNTKENHVAIISKQIQDKQQINENHHLLHNLQQSKLKSTQTLCRESSLRHSNEFDKLSVNNYHKQSKECKRHSKKEEKYEFENTFLSERIRSFSLIDFEYVRKRRSYLYSFNPNILNDHQTYERIIGETTGELIKKEDFFSNIKRLLLFDFSLFISIASNTTKLFRSEGNVWLDKIVDLFRYVIFCLYFILLFCVHFIQYQLQTLHTIILPETVHNQKCKCLFSGTKEITICSCSTCVKVDCYQNTLKNCNMIDQSKINHTTGAIMHQSHLIEQDPRRHAPESSILACNSFAMQTIPHATPHIHRHNHASFATHFNHQYTTINGPVRFTNKQQYYHDNHQVRGIESTMPPPYTDPSIQGPLVTCSSNVGPLENQILSLPAVRAPRLTMINDYNSYMRHTFDVPSNQSHDTCDHIRMDSAEIMPMSVSGVTETRAQPAVGCMYQNLYPAASTSSPTLTCEIDRKHTRPMGLFRAHNINDHHVDSRRNQNLCVNTTIKTSQISTNKIPSSEINDNWQRRRNLYSNRAHYSHDNPQDEPMKPNSFALSKLMQRVSSSSGEIRMNTSPRRFKGLNVYTREDCAPNQLINTRTKTKFAWPHDTTTGGVLLVTNDNINTSAIAEQSNQTLLERRLNSAIGSDSELYRRNDKQSNSYDLQMLDKFAYMHYRRQQQQLRNQHQNYPIKKFTNHKTIPNESGTNVGQTTQPRPASSPINSTHRINNDDNEKLKQQRTQSTVNVKPIEQQVEDKTREGDISSDQSFKKLGNKESDAARTSDHLVATKKSHQSTSGSIRVLGKVSLAGARKRLGFRQRGGTSGLSSLSVHRSEEIFPTELMSEMRLTRQHTTTSASPNIKTTPTTFASFNDSSSHDSRYRHTILESPAASDTSPLRWLSQLKRFPDPNVPFVEGLGLGQIASRQALVSPYLGDIQVSLSVRRGMLEVEIIRVRQLQPKPSAKRLPSPFVKVYLMRNKKCLAKFKTNQARQTLDPLFQQLFIFRDDYSNCVLQIIVWGDYGKKDRKSLMGIVQIHLDELDMSTSMVIGWYKLFNAPSIANTTLTSSKSLRQTISSTKLSSDGQITA